jgi:dUTP pyrophosphatase
MIVDFKRLYNVKQFPELEYPRYATDGSAGVDLRAMLLGSKLSIFPNSIVSIPTGLAIHITNPWYMGMITMRSGLSRKGLSLTNGVGIIDSDYQGELMISVTNHSDSIVTIDATERIAQLILLPIELGIFMEVKEFTSGTARGAGGFGSTGKF